MGHIKFPGISVYESEISKIISGEIKCKFHPRKENPKMKHMKKMICHNTATAERPNGSTTGLAIGWCEHHRERLNIHERGIIHEAKCYRKFLVERGDRLGNYAAVELFDELYVYLFNKPSGFEFPLPEATGTKREIASFYIKSETWEEINKVSKYFFKKKTYNDHWIPNKEMIGDFIFHIADILSAFRSLEAKLHRLD